MRLDQTCNSSRFSQATSQPDSSSMPHKGDKKCFVVSKAAFCHNPAVLLTASITAKHRLWAPSNTPAYFALKGKAP